MITKPFFDYLVWQEVLYRPEYMRRGQSVFNTVSYLFGVAREVQFVAGIDCFYDDSQVEAFLDAAYKCYLKHSKENN